MGMFDEIRCAVHIDGCFDEDIYQTKDLANDLNTYVITSYGRLLHVMECNNDGDYIELKEPIDQKYDGDLFFYDGNGNEYKAVFIGGQLSYIVHE